MLSPHLNRETKESGVEIIYALHVPDLAAHKVSILRSLSIAGPLPPSTMAPICVGETEVGEARSMENKGHRKLKVAIIHPDLGIGMHLELPLFIFY
ncbi:hypothetical protein M5K25_007785 [Dendrobium thyrsiflorum]|uniref:Uncharacterized protein n=1 Tax=Dendrobium thyrsiflorum TaxID=117978 RepID=A0ABD0VEZ4_DENTH